MFLLLLFVTWIWAQVCLKHRKVFLMEQSRYTNIELQQHIVSVSRSNAVENQMWLAGVVVVVAVQV